ncbi:hypothetical protein GQ600_13600 [Phytophthora cactorum]|nr:hypothetical protein GQ600_13600 [Phytophthora cactorum]
MPLRVPESREETKLVSHARSSGGGAPTKGKMVKKEVTSGSPATTPVVHSANQKGDLVAVRTNEERMVAERRKSRGLVKKKSKYDAGGRVRGEDGLCSGRERRGKTSEEVLTGAKEASVDTIGTYVIKEAEGDDVMMKGSKEKEGVGRAATIPRKWWRRFPIPRARLTLELGVLGLEETEDLEEVIGSELESVFAVADEKQKRAERGEDSGASDCSRLFTDVELDALEACEPGHEATVLAGVEPAVEAEEYERG